ncbi:hypothetical protein [Amycolatopsis vastitatis]|uniref:Uncharacterized protein n=1 Tax=Amycolatopsis vastitatis TaxID=1905142 RepID=A0A229T1S1_9PSEU|nr:hypothetical protein [Amycolatopsis vastitatis]OXM65215.1 hypothetical protein CF165_22985 [Amycolatopsis vastitatis]
MIMVTAAEHGEARHWLARHGQPVGQPTPLVTALIATRRPVRGRGTWRYFGYVMLAGLAASVYLLLFGPGATESAIGYFIGFGIQLGLWDIIRRRERELRASAPARPPAEPWWQVLGGWYLASLVLAFAGGAVLAGAMYFTTPDRTYAVSWLGLLGLSGLSSGCVLIGILRGPVFGADAESLAVARALRAEKIYLASPVLGVLPLAMEMLMGHGRQPAEFFPWMAGYIAAVVLLQAVSGLRHRRRFRKLPPGHYGEPAPDRDPGTPVDWSPPGY